MNRIEKFLAKSKNVELEGETFVVKALTIENIDLIADLDNEDPNKKSAAVKNIIRKIVKDNFPEATEAELNNFALVNIEPLMTAFSEVNNLDSGKLSNGIKERLAKLKENELAAQTKK
jgi:hypothetical protein